MTKTVVALATLLLGAAPSLITAVPAWASCADLSYERNAIFKRAGYCFKTAAQIANFGNAGCRYDNEADVPLSGRDRAEIAEIVRAERMRGCR